MRRRVVATLAAVTALVVVGVAGATTAVAGDQAGTGFVTRKGSDLYLNGKKFQFAGTNNYYLMYQSNVMTDDVFNDAQAAGFTVLRTWGWLDIGNQDGSNSVHGKANDIYFQYWDGTRPAYNDGPDGLQKLDYVLWKARQTGIKLVIPFTNNWRDFGGIDQYVRWRGAGHHDDFYTDPVIRGWYKDWISHVLNRTNTLTGVKYKDDPTVMTWELGNEPRCGGSGVYPRSATCTTQTLISWADDVTRHIKSVDGKHLVSVGDEGFLCTAPGTNDWTANCGEGVDTIAFATLPAVDVMSFHLYPDGWGKTPEWGTNWIKTHFWAAQGVKKAAMLGEFGLLDKSIRNKVYKNWTDAAITSGGNGFLYWILSGVQDNGMPYPDYDGFTVYCPTPVCTAISNAGDDLANGLKPRPPVADHDVAVVEFANPATLTPAANDIAYRTQVRPDTIDLDPLADGRQASASVPGGVFTASPAGVVTFVPAAGYSGKALASYTIKDLAGRTSNVANLDVTVKPDPTAAIPIASFETGTEGWASAPWQTDVGSVSQTADFHTDGAHALHIDGLNGGGWWGLNLPAPLNISGKAQIRYDLRAGSQGTSTNLAIQVGNTFDWCQGTAWTWVQSTTVTIDIDLINGLACGNGPAALADVRAIWIYIQTGPFDIDHVRAE